MREAGRVTLLTRAARRLTRHVRETPEARAWKDACRQAARVPRRTPGRIRMLGYDIGYADLLTLCPQWHDLFVKKTLDITLARPDPRILDCGANVGLASLFLKQRFRGARITAYEADASIAAVLVDNMQRNHAADVEVIPAAVWTHDGVVSFHPEGSDSGALVAVLPQPEGTAHTVVPCVRLQTVIARAAVDFLKLDIEGAEFDVLGDCAPVLHNVAALAVEVHDLDPGKRRLPGILTMLGDAGFTWSLDELLPVATAGPASSPFVRAANGWVLLVRAWRSETSA